MFSTARRLVPIADRVLVRKVEAKTQAPAPRRRTPPPPATRAPRRSKPSPLETVASRNRRHPPAQTAGGIFLPDANMQKMNEAEVIAVGPGAKDDAGALIPMDVAVGDVVLLPEYGATPVTIGDDELHLLRGSDILGKFEG
jgi:co-chaperonin GroES (HSP10)